MIEDADILKIAVQRLVEHRDTEAREALLGLSLTDPIPALNVEARVASDTPPATKRPSVSKSHLAAILRRDGWRCHYCGRKLVFQGVLEILGQLCPAEFPFLPGHHMPRERTHPAAPRVYPEVDHIHAGSIGGHWTDQENLVAACLPCNTRKSNRLGWTRGTFEAIAWQGLTELYRPLVERLENARPYHAAWLRVLGL